MLENRYMLFKLLIIDLDNDCILHGMPKPENEIKVSQ